MATDTGECGSSPPPPAPPPLSGLLCEDTIKEEEEEEDDKEKSIDLKLVYQDEGIEMDEKVDLIVNQANEAGKDCK